MTSRGERLTGRIFLIALVVVTLLPFLSMLSAALQPRGTVPTGLAWPSDPSGATSPTPSPPPTWAPC